MPYNCSGRRGISLGVRERKKEKRKPHLWCVPVSIFTSGRARANEFSHTSIFCRVDILGCFSIGRLVGLTLHLAFCPIPRFLRPRNWHKHSTVTDREQMAAPFSLNWQPQCRVSCGLGFSLPPSFPGIFPWNCVLERYSSTVSSRLAIKYCPSPIAPLTSSFLLPASPRLKILGLILSDGQDDKSRFYSLIAAFVVCAPSI